MRQLQKNILRNALAVALTIGAVPWAIADTAIVPLQTIDVQQGRAMKEKGALLLDVREPGEYEEGHAPGSKLIPLSQLKDRLQEIRDYEAKPVAVICRSGRRSAQAADILTHSGFTKVYNVQGGMNAWEAAALPVVTGKK